MTTVRARAWISSSSVIPRENTHYVNNKYRACEKKVNQPFQKIPYLSHTMCKILSLTMLRKSAVEECVLHKRENNRQRLTVMPKHSNTEDTRSFPDLGCWTAAHLSCCMETWGATLTGRQSITRLTQTDLTCLSLDCGREPEYMESIHMGTMRTCKLHTAIQWIPGTVVTIEMISPTLETE